MLNIGPQELLLILVIALIVVGPTRLPELGRSIGKGLREIRKAQDEVKRTIQVSIDEPAPTSGTRPRGRAPTQTAGAAAAASEVAPAVVPAAEPAPGTDPVPPAISPDPTPLATEPPPASEVSEISRTLGRSLAELRRAREEVQRSFRMDVRAPSPRPPARDPAAAPSEPADAEREPAPPGEPPSG